MRLQFVVGRVHQVLRQAAQQFRLCACIQRVGQFAQHMCRRHDDEFMKLIRGGGRVDHSGDLAGELVLRHLMRVGARGIGVPGYRSAFERAARPVGDEIVVAFVQGRRINRFDRMQGIVGRRPYEAGVAAIGDDNANTVVLRYGTVSS
jgi:hypothetical protein